ncbi:MAG: DUF6465 family protein [Lachnospiraceae bacterium]|nr:DUF6465 family protein [Lachnospiraceae bacterium]
MTNRTKRTTAAVGKTAEVKKAASEAVSEKAAEVKKTIDETASEKAAEVKKTIDETVSEKAAEVKKTIDETVSEKAAEVKKAVETTAAKKVVETKKAVNTAVKAASNVVKAAKQGINAKLILQYEGNETNVECIKEKAKDDFVKAGHKEEEITDIAIYLKTEDYAAYYVINGVYAGKVDLF